MSQHTEAGGVRLPRLDRCDVAGDELGQRVGDHPVAVLRGVLVVGASPRFDDLAAPPAEWSVTFHVLLRATSSASARPVTDR